MARKPPPTDTAAYDRHREQAADNQREKSRAGREIGEIPAVVDPKRRESCRLDLARFLRTYFPNAFKLKFSADHVRIVEKIQRAILSGGLLSIAMPRGSGKTTICERAVLWAALYGHCPFPLLVAADQKKSAESLAKLKLELEANPLLLADFPEVCYPIRKLERIANRVKGQTHGGEPTRMEWSRLAIVLPTIPGSVSSGAVIKTGAILSAVRGANHTKPDGTVVRPSLVLLDDPQTRASARKETQSKLREQIISADVLGCAGPGETMTALMTCTVICKGDMADRMLDRSLHPDWQGERTKLLIRWPSDPAMALWQELREKLADAMARDASPEAVLKIGVAFYRKHRAAMDDGAEVAWEERREKGHPSALYSAMMLYFKDPEAFWSEYQNEPMGGVTDSEELQTPDRLARRVNKLPRGTIPLQAQHVTASIDVQKDGLYWMISWFQDNFTGGVADYAVYPEQQKHQFTVRDLSPTLRSFTKRKSWQAALRCGLDALFDLLATRRFQRPDGATMSIERILVDANWGDSTEIVYQACRESAHSAILRPAHGIAIKPTRRPMSDMKTDGSDKPGDHWIERTHAKFKSRYLLIDVNHWKSAAHDALSIDVEERHSVSLFAAKPHEHRLLAEHLTAETRTRVEANGRSSDVWELKPGQDNHWFDTLIGTFVAASRQGVKLTDPEAKNHRKPKRRLSTAEIQARRQKVNR